MADNPDEFYFLSAADRDYIKQRLYELEQRLLNPDRYEKQDQVFDTPDVYIAKLDTDLAGRDTETGKLGSAELPIYRIKLNDASEPTSDATLEPYTLLDEDETPFKLRVYNFYPVKWYSAGEPTYFRISRAKFGLWLCEKPPYRHKCKAIADILPGSTAPTVDNTQLYINGAGSVNIKALDDWMNNGIKISNGKEGIVEYFEDQKHWSWVEAECEDAA